MSYVESVLGKNESVLYEAKVSLLPYWLSFLLGALLVAGGFALLFTSGVPSYVSVIPLVVAALVLIPPFVAISTTELVITNKRIIAKFGLISRRTLELQLSKVESIRVDQGIIARIFNYGTVIVVGTGGSMEPIPRISAPLAFRKQYDEILDSHGNQTPA